MKSETIVLQYLTQDTTKIHASSFSEMFQFIGSLFQQSALRFAGWRDRWNSGEF